MSKPADSQLAALKKAPRQYLDRSLIMSNHKAEFDKDVIGKDSFGNDINSLGQTFASYQSLNDLLEEHRMSELKPGELVTLAVPGLKAQKTEIFRTIARESRPPVVAISQCSVANEEQPNEVERLVGLLQGMDKSDGMLKITIRKSRSSSVETDRRIRFDFRDPNLEGEN